MSLFWAWPKSCFTVDKLGILKTNVPPAPKTCLQGNPQPPDGESGRKQPGLFCPHCREGHHRSNECQSKTDKRWSSALWSGGKQEEGPALGHTASLQGTRDFFHDTLFWGMSTIDKLVRGSRESTGLDLCTANSSGFFQHNGCSNLSHGRVCFHPPLDQ